MKSQSLIVFLALSLFCGCATTNKIIIKDGNKTLTITEREANKKAVEQINRDLQYMNGHGVIFQPNNK